MPEYILNEWPARIYVKQEGLGVVNINIYDADTGEQMTAVMQLAISHYEGSVVQIIQSKYTPAKPLVMCKADDPDLAELEMQGVVCATRTYPIAHLELTAGAPDERHEYMPR